MSESCINYEEEDESELIEANTQRIPSDDFDYDFIDLLDKKIEIEYNGEKAVGHLWWCGINKLHGQYQVTLGRTPCWPVDKNTIKLYKERIRIHET